MLRVAFRPILLLASLIAFCLGHVPAARSQRLCRTARHSRRILRVLGIRVSRHGRPLQARGLLVANHLGWLDPLILFALAPATFVTSQEIAATPGLGALCRRAGCLFVERRRAAATSADCRMLQAALQHGPVVVFPEATSSDGRRVGIFKPACFQSAIDAGSLVTPLAMRFCRVGGRPVHGRRRDLVHWYGDMGFAGHLLRLLVVRSVEAALWVGDSFASSSADRRQLAARAQQDITAAYQRLA